MIHIKYSRHETRLQVRGHAGFAPEGQDIVCAGISALLCALAMHPLTQDMHIEHDWMVLLPIAGAEDVMRPYYDMIHAAMQDIAHQHPLHVCVHDIL